MQVLSISRKCLARNAEQAPSAKGSGAPGIKLSLLRSWSGVLRGCVWGMAFTFLSLQSSDGLKPAA